METIESSRQIIDIYVVNPAATSGNDKFVPAGVDPMFTVADREKNIDSLLERLTNDEAEYRVHLCGGDGTVGWAVTAAALSGKNVDLRLRAGGYKNDISTMVKKAGGSLMLAPLLLEKQQDSEPAEGQNNSRWIPQKMIAYSFGTGLIGAGARIANSKDWRRQKAERIDSIAEKWLPRRLARRVGSILSDLRLVRSTLNREVEIDGEKVPATMLLNGQRIGGLIISNGERMSGGGIKFRGQGLGQRGFMSTTVGYKKDTKIVGGLLRAVGRDPFYDVRHIGTAKSFTINETTVAQADGEDFALDAGTYRIRELSKLAVKVSLES